VHDELSRPNILRREKDGIDLCHHKRSAREEIAMRDFVREGRGSMSSSAAIKPPALDPELGNEQREAGWVILARAIP
jgi:hypothetical protein